MDCKEASDLAEVPSFGQESTLQDLDVPRLTLDAEESRRQLIAPQPRLSIRGRPFLALAIKRKNSGVRANKATERRQCIRHTLTISRVA